MRISDQKKQEIISTFQQTFKHNENAEAKAKTYSLDELQQADEMLGKNDVNAGYRLAIKNRIKELAAIATRTEQRRHESVIRGWNLITGIIIGLVIAGLSKWLG